MLLYGGGQGGEAETVSQSPFHQAGSESAMEMRSNANVGGQPPDCAEQPK